MQGPDQYPIAWKERGVVGFRLIKGESPKGVVAETLCPFPPPWLSLCLLAVRCWGESGPGRGKGKMGKSTLRVGRGNESKLVSEEEKSCRTDPMKFPEMSPRKFFERCSLLCDRSSWFWFGGRGKGALRTGGGHTQRETVARPLELGISRETRGSTTAAPRNARESNPPTNTPTNTPNRPHHDGGVLRDPLPRAGTDLRVPGAEQEEGRPGRIVRVVLVLGVPGLQEQLPPRVLPHDGGRLAPGPVRVRALPVVRVRQGRHREALHRGIRQLPRLRHDRGHHGRQVRQALRGHGLRRFLRPQLRHEALEQLPGSHGRAAPRRDRDLPPLLDLRVLARRRALQEGVRGRLALRDLLQGRFSRQRTRRHCQRPRWQFPSQLLQRGQGRALRRLHRRPLPRRRDHHGHLVRELRRLQLKVHRHGQLSEGLEGRHERQEGRPSRRNPTALRGEPPLSLSLSLFPPARATLLL